MIGPDATPANPHFRVGAVSTVSPVAHTATTPPVDAVMLVSSCLLSTTPINCNSIGKNEVTQ